MQQNRASCLQQQTLKAPVVTPPDLVILFPRSALVLKETVTILGHRWIWNTSSFKVSPGQYAINYGDHIESLKVNFWLIFLSFMPYGELTENPVYFLF